MKKLLSICFLSILLGLLSFSASAQNGNPVPCGGFWIENLQPDVVSQVANVGASELPLSHTLGNAVRTGSGIYVGNAEMNREDLYELHICGCDIDDNKKVSIDWELFWLNPATGEYERVNDNLDQYAELSIYTQFRELNADGSFQRVSWLGGQVPNGMGFCEPVQDNPNDPMHSPQCDGITNYPGAMQAQVGLPGSVANALGEPVPAIGQTPIYTQGLDYFYMHFLKQTRTIVHIKWQQYGKFFLVMKIRERIGNTTDWTNLWYDNDETKYIGGHMSCCGEVLFTDTIGYPVFDTLRTHICEDADPLVLGSPESFSFDRTIPDTNVIIGNLVTIPGTDCAYLDVDSVRHVCFYVRHNPVVRYTNKVKEYCACDDFTVTPATFGLRFDPKDLDVAIDTAFYWQTKGRNATEQANPNNWVKDIMTAWGPNAKTIDDNKDTIYTYIVRQVNTYLYAGETIVCEGPIDTFYLKIKSVKAPTLAMDKAEICREQVNENVTLKITSTPGECGSSTRWYTNINTSGGNSYEFMMNNPGNRFTSRIITSSEIVVNTTNKNELVVNLESFMPKTNKDTTIYFMATTVDPTIDGCESKFFNIVKFDIHKTPEITIVQPKAINCPGATVDMKVTITNNPDPRYTYYWEGDVDVASEDVEKTVGTGSGTTAYFPANNYYNHSYSQQIFTSEEIGATGTIKTIAFQNANTSTTNGNLRRNVTVSFALTDKVAFNSNASAADGREWITDGLTDVFEGVLDCNKANEWIELQLNTPFNYDGTKNLVVVVYDHSSNYSSAVKFKTTPKQGAAMHAYEDSGNPMTRAKTSRYVRDYRNNMKFTFEAEVASTDAKTATEHYTISDNAQCNDSYLATIKVKDGNGCYSEPDTFRFGVGVEHAPTVSGVPTKPFIVYTCELNADGIPTWEYEDLEDYDIIVTDDCNKGMSLTKSDAPILNGVCNDTLVRTYTVHNLCDSTVSFTVTYISVDTTKPEFHIAEGVSPYVRLLPVRAENCKYDAPEKDVLVNAVLGRVSDNCAEMDFNYLMSHAEFYWQNSNIPVVGSKDIFGAALEQDLGYTIGNQLTVRVHVWDNCGNAADSVLIYFNRPDTLHVEYPSITNDLGRRPGICQDSSFTLTFDPDQVKFDHDFTPALPLHYEWQCEQTDVVIATPNEPQTRVTPQGVDKVYIFRMHVTDDLGCDAYSEPMQVRVKANPNIVIVPDIRNGAEFPLCPTYGVLTLEVVDATTLTQVPNLHYTWSGESVNNASTDDTSSVYIIPDRCTETYYPTVDVYDLEYHCPATAVLEVPVTDTVGPKYYGEPIHDTVPVLAGCIYKVPDFIHYLNNSNLIDNCYPFSTFTITQVPAEGTVIDKDTAVTIRVKTPCDNKTYEIKGKFFANLPLDRLMASAEAVPTSGCSGTEFTITGSYSNNHGDVTFAWKKNGTSVNNNTNTITEQNFVAAGQDSTDYTYSLVVRDELGCTAPASATVRVYKTVTDVQTATYPNTHCAAPWDGSLAVLHALKVNKYEIVFTPTDQTLPVIRDVRNSEVPGIDTQVEETTHIFDKLPEGSGILYVTTPKGCTTDFNFTISGNRPTIAAPVVTAVAPTTCKNIDGKLVFTIETGYSYEVRNANNEIVTNYNALTPGMYSVKKIDNATLCESELAYAEVKQSEASLTLYASHDNNTSCTEPNGKLRLLNANTVHCNVFFAGEEIAHDKQGTTTIENLAAGVYTTYAADSASGCQNVRYDTIENDIVYPSFTIKTEPNNYCQNEDNLVNGKITLTPATGYTYTVTSGDAVITDLTALAAGNYHIKAVSAEGCVTERDTFIVDDLYYPALGDTNFTANTICTENGPFDGAVEIVVTATGDNVITDPSGNCTWTVVMSDTYGDGWGSAGSIKFSQAGQADQTFTVTSADGKNNVTRTVILKCGVPVTITFNKGNYEPETRFAIYDQRDELVWSKYENYGYSSTYTTSGSLKIFNTNVTCGTSGISPDAARDQYIKNYSITFEGVTTENIDQNSVTYSGLDNGLYKFSFVSAYKCASPEYTVEVPQYEYPKLAMHATPNTMCVPTFEHPGNGTIVIDNTPTYTFCDINRYDYVFYYANPSNVEVPGDRLEVPYFNMDNYTMYHLTDTLYYVDLFDNLKGCHIHDTITVPHADDYVTGTAQATANKNCKAPYDGTVTVDATAYNADNTVNVDAVLRYSIVSADFSMPYQVSNVFTGVKDGSYIVLVKDTTTGCVYTLDEPVEVDQTPNDITINYTTTPNHACVSGFDGTLTATATSNIFTNADYVYKLQGEEEYTANHYWTGLHGQYTVYVMDNVSGCTAEALISITDDNICIPDVTITPNNNNNYGEDYGFCANTENAQLIALATKDASCPAGDFKYTWTIQCHQIVSEGATLNINTNVTQDECCIYDLHVEDLGTGCTKDTSVRVCIFVRNYPSFVSRTHEINNNRIVACQNDNVNIGVDNPTQWNKVIWSGGEQTYVTPAGETYDPDFTISARELQTNHLYTYCVDVEDNLGCWARGNISLTTKDTSSVVVYDTACSGDKQGEWTIWENTTYEPITFTQDVVVGQNVNGCDSVVHYYHTVLPDANADFTKLPKVIDTVFCTPSYILQAMYDSVKVKVGTLKLYRNVSKNPPAIWELVDKDAPVFVASIYTDYKFVVENGDCDPLEHEFRVFYDSVPSVVTLTADDYYCAGEDGTVNAGVTVFGAGVHQVKAYMKDNEDVILGSDYTVFGYNDVSFTFPMYRKYNGKTLVVEAYGDCGSTKKEVTLVVDTDYINLPALDPFCEGDTLPLAQILGTQAGTGMSNITAWLKKVEGGTAVTQDYDASIVFSDEIPQSDVFVDFDGTTWSIDNNIQMMARKANGSANPMYYTNGAALRLYAGNTLTITPTNGMIIDSVALHFGTNDGSNTISVVADDESATILNGIVKNINASQNVVFTVGGSSGNRRIASIYVHYYDDATNNQYGTAVRYIPGTALEYPADNQAKLFFTASSRCSDVVYCDSTVITVNPKPRLAVNDELPEYLCVDGLADALEAFAQNNIETQYADREGWLYKAPTYVTVEDRTVIWSEGFDNGIPSTWTNIDYDGDTHTWMAINDYYSDNAVLSYSYQNFDSFDADDWLFTPAFTVDNTTTLSFKAMNYSASYPDHIELYVLPTNEVPNPINTNDAVLNITPGTSWSQYSVDFSQHPEYVGQSVYVAFRHNDYDQFRIYLDDVTLSSVTSHQVATYPLVYTYVLTEDFESAENWQTIGWTIVDADEDNLGWEIQNPSDLEISDAHSGTHVAASWSWDTYAIYPDNWMISPAVLLPENATLSFFTQGNPMYPDHYSVYVSTSSDYQVIENLVPVFEGYTPDERSDDNSSSIWKEETVDLSAFAGQTVYVAFRHHESDDMNYIFIDDFTIKAGSAGLVPASSVSELVNAIQNSPEVKLYYYAANGCDSIAEDLGTLRLLHKMELNDATITVCPNEKLSDRIADLNTLANNSVRDNGNLAADEYAFTFWGGNNYATEISSNTKISEALNNGKIRMIVTPTETACGGDTALISVTVLTNTFKPDTLQPACDGAPLRDFVKTQPQWTGTAQVVDQYWEAYQYQYATDSYVRVKVTLDSIMLAERWPDAYYVFVTECGDTIKTSTVNEGNVTLEFNFTPTVTINEQYDTLTKCLGDTIKLAELNYTAEFVDILVPDGANPLNHNADQVMGDTAWTINGTSYAADGKIVVTTDHNLSLLVLSVESECGAGYDTLVVKVAPIPEPSAKGDNTICLNDATILTVVDANPTSVYTWFLVNEDEESTAGDYEIASGTIAEITFSTDNLDDNHTTITGNVDGFTVERQDFYHFYVVETSEYNCTSVTMENESDIMLGESDVITIKSTDLPQFKFYTRDTVENKHFYTTTGEENQYLWEISGDCPNSDMRLFVEFYIYKDNELIAHVGDDFDVRTTGSGTQAKPWMHSDTLSWFTSLNHYTSRVMFYNNSVPGNQNAQGVFDGNHFPNTNLVGSGAADYYDWLYYHYFNHRKIVSTLVPFTKTGEYTFVYKLWSTSLGMEINDLYTDEVTGELRKIGGANCMAAGTTLKLIAEDSLFFHVTGENYGPVSTDPVVAPSLAPEVVVETVAPEMEVWPNPASAITTTLKARVHHMAGDATVTLTNLTGKSIYNGTMYIDNDNYYFEVGVNNLSVGSYVMTVRTNDAVITKKVVVAPLTK